MKDFRRAVGAIVIASFSVAALLGIVALLSGGEFGETQVKVLLTTVTVGATSLAALCYLAVVGHRLAAVGVVGALSALICAGTALWWIWVPDSWLDEGPWKLFFTTLILALTFAQASLLIAVADRDRLRVGLAATLGAASVVAVMLIIPIVTEEFSDVDAYWRAFGVVAILDVLGTIVLIAIGAVGRRTTAAAPAPAGALDVGPAVTARIVQLADQRGVTPEQLLTEALDRISAHEVR